MEYCVRLSQSPDLNPIKMVGDDMDLRVKSKGATCAQHLREHQDCSVQVKDSHGDDAKSMQGCHQSKF